MAALSCLALVWGKLALKIGFGSSGLLLFLTENYLDVFFKIRFTLNSMPVFYKMESFQLRKGIPMPNIDLVIEVILYILCVF